MIEWYKKSKIYWHAAGYGIDQWQQPEKVEHFGITTVEAMAAGCVPIVINKGGQKEILGTQLATLLWDDLPAAEHITSQLIDDPKSMKHLSQIAQQRAQYFSQTRFERVLTEMIEGSHD
jgi:glycosyltransferase involved in cell wall biosynthesis